MCSRSNPTGPEAEAAHALQKRPAPPRQAPIFDGCALRRLSWEIAMKHHLHLLLAAGFGAMSIGAAAAVHDWTATRIGTFDADILSASRT